MIAPDGRGYGGSTVTNEVSDYRTERHNLDMVALLDHLQKPKAVWIGHDWGAPVVWAFAAHYPEKCVAICNMCVPYRLIEFGIDYIASLSDRNIYPEKEMPAGQWAYMQFHNEHPEEMARQIDRNPYASQKIFFGKANPAELGKPCATAFVKQNGGFFPGDETPDIPIEFTILKGHEDVLEALAKTIRDNGSHGPNDYYRNMDRNAEYAKASKNGGKLDFPVLFIGATYDFVLDTKTNPKQLGPMREYCSDLQEVHIDAGHWVAFENPGETNAALAKWLAQSVKDYWPGQKLERPSKI